MNFTGNIDTVEKNRQGKGEAKTQASLPLGERRLFGLEWRRPGYYLVIESGGGVFKYLALHRSKRGYTVDSFGLFQAEEFPPEMRGDPADFHQAALARVLEDRGLRDREIIVVSSDMDFFVRRLDLPRLNKKEVENAVLWEADKLMPIRIEDSYVHIKRDRSRSGNIPVTVGAVPRAQVDQWDYIGDRLTGVIPTAAALAAVGPEIGSADKAYCFIYCNEERLNIGLYNCDGLQYSHPTQSTSGKVHDPREPLFSVKHVVEELIASIEVFYSYFPDIVVDGIVLIAPDDDFHAVAEGIRERLDINILNADSSLQCLDDGGRIGRDMRMEMVPLLGAVHVASRNFRFIPNSLVEGSRLKRVKKIARYCFASAAILALLLGSFWFYRANALSAQYESAVKLKDTMAGSDAYRRITANREASALLLSIRDRLLTGNEESSTILRVMSSATPDHIYIQSLKTSKRDSLVSVNVTGYYDGDLSRGDLAMMSFMESLYGLSFQKLRLQRLGSKISGNRKVESFVLDGDWRDHE